MPQILDANGNACASEAIVENTIICMRAAVRADMDCESHQVFFDLYSPSGSVKRWKFVICNIMTKAYSCDAICCQVSRVKRCSHSTETAQYTCMVASPHVDNWVYRLRTERNNMNPHPILRCFLQCFPLEQLPFSQVPSFSVYHGWMPCCLIANYGMGLASQMVINVPLRASEVRTGDRYHCKAFFKRILKIQIFDSLNKT